MKILSRIMQTISIILFCCILSSCNNNIGGNSTELYSKQATAASSELTVQLRSDYGGIIDGSTNNSRSPSIVLYFNKPIDVNSINKENIGLYDSVHNSIPSTNFSFSQNLQSIVFSPAAKLNSNSEYFIDILTSVKAIDGSHLISPVRFSFKTDTNLNPSLALIDPYEGNLSEKPTIQIAFSEPDMQIRSTYISLRYSSTGSIISSSLNCSSDNRICSITPTVSIKNKEFYTYITQGITDSSGNKLVKNYTFNFKAGDGIIPTVSMINPVNNSKQISTSTTIQLSFSESVNYVNQAVSLHIGSPGGDKIDASITTYNRQQYLIKPIHLLPINSLVYVVIANGVVSDKGAIIPPSNFQFTTSDVNTPTVTLISPTSSSIPISSNFILEFSTTVYNVNNNIKLLDASKNIIPVEINNNGTTYTVKPKQLLINDLNYTLRIESGITDNLGTRIVPVDYGFVTVKDTQNPSATILNLAANGFLSPLASQYIDIMFSESVIKVNKDNVAIFGDHCGDYDHLIPIESISLISNNIYKIALSTSSDNQNPLGFNLDYVICFSTEITDNNKNPIFPSSLAFNTKIYKDSIESSTKNSGSSGLFESYSVPSAMDSKGNIYLANTIYDSANNFYYLYLVKYNINGAIESSIKSPLKLDEPLWCTIPGKTEYCEITIHSSYIIDKIIIDNIDNPYIIGHSNYTVRDKPINKDFKNGVIFSQKFDHNLKQIWSYVDNKLVLDTSRLYNRKMLGATTDGSSYLIIAGNNHADDKNTDCNINELNLVDGKLIKHASFYPKDDNYCSASAAISSDNNFFYITGQTQGKLDISGSSQKTPNGDDYEGFIVRANYNGLSFDKPVQFATDHNDGNGRTQPNDLAILNRSMCSYLATVGTTNYQLANATTGMSLPNNKDDYNAFAYFYPISGENCSAQSTMLGLSGQVTSANSIIVLPDNSFYIAGNISGALPGWQKKSPPGNLDSFIISKSKDTNITPFKQNEVVQITSSIYNTLSVITGNSIGGYYYSGSSQSKFSPPLYYINYFNLF